MEVSKEVLVVMLGEIAPCVDLDSSSKYSSENLED